MVELINTQKLSPPREKHDGNGTGNGRGNGTGNGEGNGTGNREGNGTGNGSKRGESVGPVESGPADCNVATKYLKNPTSPFEKDTVASPSRQRYTDVDTPKGSMMMGLTPAEMQLVEKKRATEAEKLIKAEEARLAEEVRRAEAAVRMDGEIIEARERRESLILEAKAGVGRSPLPKNVPLPPGKGGKGGEKGGKSGKGEKGKGGKGGGNARGGRWSLKELNDTSGTIWESSSFSELGTFDLIDEHIDAGLMTLFKKQKKAPSAEANSPKSPKKKGGSHRTALLSHARSHSNVLCCLFISLKPYLSPVS